MAINRNEIRMSGRYQRRIETNEDNTGARGAQAIDTRACKLKFYKFGEVKKYYDVNVLPFQVGRNHPAVVAGELKPGDWDYALDFFIHRNVGPDKGTYVCLKKTFGKACPMCEEAQKIADDQGTDAATGMWASKRSLICIQPLDERGHGADVPMLLECAYNNFTHDLTDAATACMRGEGVVDFANPGPNGREISFQVGEDTMGGGRKYKIAKNFAFNKRREEIPESVLDAVPCLDSLLVVPTAEQVSAAMFGAPATDDRPSRDQERDRETRDYDRNQSRRDDEPPARGYDRGGRDERDERPQERTLRGSDGRDFEDPFPDQPTGLERGGSDERHNDPEPPREERPRPKREPEPPKDEGTCPHGYAFGTDCDKKSLCYDCPDAIYGRCKRASGR